MAHPETLELLSSSSILVGNLGHRPAFQAFCSKQSLRSFHLQERLVSQFGALSNLNLEVPNQSFKRTQSQAPGPLNSIVRPLPWPRLKRFRFEFRLSTPRSPRKVSSQRIRSFQRAAEHHPSSALPSGAGPGLLGWAPRDPFSGIFNTVRPLRRHSLLAPHHLAVCFVPAQTPSLSSSFPAQSNATPCLTFRSTRTPPRAAGSFSLAFPSNRSTDHFSRGGIRLAPFVRRRLEHC